MLANMELFNSCFRSGGGSVWSKIGFGVLHDQIDSKSHSPDIKSGALSLVSSLVLREAKYHS